MDNQINGTLETHPPPPGSVDFQQKLGDLSHAQIPDVLSNSPSVPGEFVQEKEGDILDDNHDKNDENGPVSASVWSEEWQWNVESDTNSKSLVGAGLVNLGNTCFLNAVLQCFTHTVTLIQGLWSSNHAMPCNTDEFCVYCAFCEHSELSLASKGRIFSPLKLVDNLRYISTSFCRYEQEDAHEFFQCFLDRLERCCNVSTSKNEDDNFVKQVFGGRLVSKLRCCNCNHVSDTYEPLIDLSLEIGDANSLLTALESFTKVEKIEDPEAKFTCENCKEQVSVEKQLKLEEVPKVAAFHLKRFKNDGSFVEKVDKHLDFPLELDLEPYCSGSNNNHGGLKYELYAVVVHTGFSSTSGHYYCFIRSAPDTWYKFDDSKVLRVHETCVLKQEAYILLYAKQDTPWFSTFMRTENPLPLCQYVSKTSPQSVLDHADQISTLSPSLAIEHETINTKNHLHEVHAPLLNSLDKASCKIEMERKVSTQETIITKRDFSDLQSYKDITPCTPPWSPSPDIYDDEPAELEVQYTKPRNHEKIVEVSCKRELNKELDDVELKQARKLCKTMPGSRGSKLLAFVKGSSSGGLGNSKKSRSKLVSPRIVSRPLAAGSYR